VGEKIASLAFFGAAKRSPSQARFLVEPWSRLLVNSSDFNLNRCRMLFRGLTILTSNLYGTLWRKMAQVIGRISRLG
jgi:hypothetical protein